MEKVKEEVVVIKWAGTHSKILPKELISEVTKKVGSKINMNTRDILRGLTTQEEKFLLPNFIGRSVTSHEWDEKVKLFYANLTIPIPQTGLKLNKATFKKEVLIDNKTIEVDYPVNVSDYIRYKQLLVDNTVSKNPNVKFGYKFILLDDSIEKEKRKSLNSNILKLQNYRVDLLSKDKEGNFKELNKIKYILRLSHANPDILDDEEKESKIFELVEKDTSLIKSGKKLSELNFYKLYNDENLRFKNLIQLCINHSIIAKEGNTYVDSDDNNLVLGRTLDEAVIFLKNEQNSQQYNTYVHKLKGKVGS